MLLTAAGADDAGASAAVGFRWCWPRIRFRRAFSRDRPDVIQCDMVAIQWLIEENVNGNEVCCCAAAAATAAVVRFSSVISRRSTQFRFKRKGLRAGPPRVPFIGVIDQ